MYPTPPPCVAALTKTTSGARVCCRAALCAGKPCHMRSISCIWSLAPLASRSLNNVPTTPMKYTLFHAVSVFIYMLIPCTLIYISLRRRSVQPRHNNVFCEFLNLGSVQRITQLTSHLSPLTWSGLLIFHAPYFPTLSKCFSSQSCSNTCIQIVQRCQYVWYFGLLQFECLSFKDNILCCAKVKKDKPDGLGKRRDQGVCKSQSI